MTYSPKMRVITVSFAVPHDDPCFKASGMRDAIQETFYDEQGMAGSFVIDKITEHHDPKYDAHSGEGSITADFFDVERFDGVSLSVKETIKSEM